MKCLCCDPHESVASWCEMCKRINALKKKAEEEFRSLQQRIDEVHLHYHELARANEKLVLWDALQDYEKNSRPDA